MREACLPFHPCMRTRSPPVWKWTPTSLVGGHYMILVVFLHSMMVLCSYRNQPAVLNQGYMGQFQKDTHECPQMSFKLFGCKCFLGRQFIGISSFSKPLYHPTKVNYHQDKQIQLSVLPITCAWSKLYLFWRCGKDDNNQYATCQTLNPLSTL